MTASPARMNCVKRYLLYSFLGHLGWEVVQLPLYTIFWSAPAGTTAFAVLHCTVGDMMIAATTLAVSYLIAGAGLWPSARRAYRRVAIVTVLLGVFYTTFSEWLNTTVRQRWDYMPAMPIVPGVDVGLTPVLQWIAVPLFAFWLAARHTATRTAIAREHGAP